MIRATFLSRPALGLALALATVAGAGLVASPAIAAEKAKAPAPLKLKLSKDFQAASNAVLVGWQATKKRPDVVAKEAEMKAAEQALIAATTRRAQTDAQKVYDGKQAELLALVKTDTDALEAAKAKIAGNDDKYQAGSIQLDMGLFTGSQALQRAGLELELQSGFVPAEKVPLFNYYVGKFAYSAKDYAGARAALQTATAGGYHDGEADRYLAETYFAQNDGPGGMKVLRDANELARTQGRAASVAGLQRGLKVYKEVCAACHSMNLVAFRTLGEEGGLGYSEAQVKALAAEYTVQDGPNDDGEMFDRPGRPSDHFPSPFPNTQAAAAANGGAAPPDFSLIAKARGVERGFPTFVFDIFTQYAQGGPDYIHALLTGFDETPPAGMQIAEGTHYNPYFIAGKSLKMPPPLAAEADPVLRHDLDKVDRPLGLRQFRGVLQPQANSDPRDLSGHPSPSV